MRAPSGLYRGMLFGIPMGLALWAGIIAGVSTAIRHLS